MASMLLLLLPLMVSPPAPVCRLVSVPLTRNPALTYFIARALPDTLEANASKGPTLYGNEFMSASTPPGLLPLPPAETRVFGQLVALEQVGGRGADALRTLVTHGGRLAVLIPWAYQANCSPVLWQGSARWVEPDSVGFFVAQLRPENEWVGGRPTFDVGAAWHQPYPYGEFLKYERERGGTSKPELTVAEVWDLYQVLPTPDSLQSAPVQAIGPVRAWARSHPDAASRWPATRILQFLEFMAKPDNR